MKTKLTILKLAVILCSAFATTAVFGQATYTWTNAAGGDLATAANWSPNGLLSGLPGPGDIAQWDGVAAGPLIITYGTTLLPNTGLGTFGVHLVFTANQVSSVNFTSTASAGSAVLAINNIDIASGAGAVTIGNPAGPGPGNTYLFNIVTRPSGALHDFVNNSANAAAINGDVRWQAGGGTVHTLDFDGTGNWVVNNYLVNDNGPGILIQKDGSGTMTWTPAGYLGTSALSSPITINAGTLVLAGNHPRLGSQAIVNNATFRFNAPAQSQTLSGVLSGAGQLQVNNGTLTLSGANTYTGSTVLNGGELIAGSAENAGTSGPLGVGGTISFTGGTLGFSGNNALDYSSRFSPAAGQAYAFDTGGQDVTFATGLGSSGGTLAKLGPGTLTLTGTSSYSGATMVSAGKLVFQGSKTGSGNITVADGAALDIYDTGTQVTPGTLMVGTSGGAALEFNGISSPTTAPLAPTTFSSTGTVTININSGTFTVGQSYPLLAWTSGSAPAVTLGVLDNFIGSLSTNGNTIRLNITATAYQWTGSNSGSWDLVAPNNWQQNGSPVTFANGGPALFDDTAAGTNVTLNAPVQPTTVTVSNNSLPYSIASSGGNNLGGSARLIKSGSGTLTLSGGANTYAGVTIVGGGTMSVAALANGGSASDIGGAGGNAANLVLDGGTLRYTGGAVGLDRLFTLGLTGGTLDASGSGALNLNNPGTAGSTGNGPRTLTLTGTNADDNTLAASLANYGGTTMLAKSGAGKWVLSGNNMYSGGTTIAGGTLQVGAGGASGSLGSGDVVNNGALILNRTGTLTNTATISGPGSITINPGSTLQVGAGGTSGVLASGAVSDNGVLAFSRSDNITFGGVISGAGSVVKSGIGTMTLTSDNTYIGTNTVNGGTLFINGSNSAVANFLNFSTLGGTGTLSGPLTLGFGSRLSPGASAGSIGTLTINSDLTIGGGNLAIELSKSLSPSNDFVVVSGTLTNATGSITVLNIGPALTVGDKFTLFNKPLQHGATLAISGAGATWTNNLAVDGSITVLSITRPALNFTRTGNSLQFSWDNSFGIYRLQAQTNSLSVGLSNNWSDYPGGGTSPVTVPIDTVNGTVFFRLISP